MCIFFHSMGAEFSRDVFPGGHRRYVFFYDFRRRGLLVTIGAFPRCLSIYRISPHSPKHLFDYWEVFYSSFFSCVLGFVVVEAMHLVLFG